MRPSTSRDSARAVLVLMDGARANVVRDLLALPVMLEHLGVTIPDGMLLDGVPFSQLEPAREPIS